MFKNNVEPRRPHMTIWRMRIACWKPKATNGLSEYAMLIDIPLQQWLQERASLLRYTYIACLVITTFDLLSHAPSVPHVARSSRKNKELEAGRIRERSPRVLCSE